MSDPVGAPSRRVTRWLIALMLVVAATAFVVWRIGIGIGYPGQVTTPEVVGLVASITSDPDFTAAHVVLTDGRTMVVPRSDRSLGGLGDLLFIGSQPERWHLAGHRSQEPGCYWISASRAYAEPGSVVFAFEEWPGVGVRLPKAPHFDDSRLATVDFQGRLRYSSIGPVSLCSDEQGRINGPP